MNAAKIEASVDRWIAEAKAYPNREARRLLVKRAVWVNEQLALCGRSTRYEPGASFALADARDALMAAAQSLH